MASEAPISGRPAEVLQALKENEKTEKGEYCIVMDVRDCPGEETEKAEAEISTEAKLIEEMKKGKTLREAQEALVTRGEKKTAVKQAGIQLKQWFGE